MTRVLFIGYTKRGQTSGMRAASLARLGMEVRSVDAGSIWSAASYLQRVTEQQRGKGRAIDAFNATVRNAIGEWKPDVIWAEKQEHLDPQILADARARGIRSIHYNPDPYFTLAWKQTPAASAGLRLYDMVVVTKAYELERYRAHGVRMVTYSPLGFDILHHSPPRETPPLEQDVAFVGGWEPRREELLSAAWKTTPRIAVWGYGWRIAQRTRLDPLRALRLGRLTPGKRLYWGAPRPSLRGLIRQGESASGEIYAERYVHAVAASRIALGLLREVCPDQHTTRTFEIPAMGGFLLADRSDEHLEFFTEGKEAEYFSGVDELVDKIGFYSRHDAMRARIAARGRERALSSGYSYDERLRAVLAEFRAA